MADIPADTRPSWRSHGDERPRLPWKPGVFASALGDRELAEMLGTEPPPPGALATELAAGRALRRHCRSRAALASAAYYARYQNASLVRVEVETPDGGRPMHFLVEMQNGLSTAIRPIDERAAAACPAKQSSR